MEDGADAACQAKSSYVGCPRAKVGTHIRSIVLVKLGARSFPSRARFTICTSGHASFWGVPLSDSKIRSCT
eukprot:4742725-Prymnesium_polylepis.2